jgi:hypothetical protein
VLVTEDERRPAGGLRNGPPAQGFAEDHRMAAESRRTWTATLRAWSGTVRVRTTVAALAA